MWLEWYIDGCSEENGGYLFLLEARLLKGKSKNNEVFIARFGA